MREEDFPMRAMMNLGHVWRRVIERRMSDLGLSSIQSRVLGYLYMQAQREKKVFQKELEQTFQIRKSSVTSVIQMLEKNGLVRRVSVPGDARQKELVLTGQGAAVQNTVMERLKVLEDLVNSALEPEEMQMWFSCIRKIEARLKEEEYDH